MFNPVEGVVRSRRARREAYDRTMRGKLRVGVCQTAEILGDVESALECIDDFAAEADAQDVDVLLFPECFLQGYLTEEQHVRRHAIDLTSAAFGSILKQLGRRQPTLVFGVIEQNGQRCFNTTVVVSRGRLAGIYRKRHLGPGESVFHNGEDSPTFELNGVRFGINICRDTRFAEAAAPIAAQGGRLLLVPAQNMMPHTAAAHWKDLHNMIRAERARETGMWVASADVTGNRNDDRVGLGPTSVINPQGEVVAQVPLMSIGMVAADIE